MSIQEALSQGASNGGVNERRNSLTGAHSRVPGRRTFSISGVREMVAPAPQVKSTEQELINASRARLSSAAPELVQYVCCDVPTSLKYIGSDPFLGLSSHEAAKRLATFGPNELAKAPPTPFWKMVLEQFNDLLVILLLIAALLSAGLGDYEATIVIFLILIANATLGVRQEYRAGRDLDALQNLTTPKAPVIRDGKQVIISSADLVPGDIITFDAGQSVPADCRLIESQDLSSTEQSLTGESEPVKKDAKFIGVPPEERAAASGPAPLSPTALEKADSKENNSSSAKKGQQEEKKSEDALTDKNCVYFGCHIQDGRGKGVVITTGMRTRMGEIKKMIDDADEHDTPLQEKLQKLGVRLGLISIFLCAIIFVIVVATGSDEGCKTQAWLCDLQSAVALVVAAVPEGLPACVTITLAIGMQRLSKKNCLITKLKSVETLGSATIICTDKTGTLTRGVMTAVRLWIAGQTWKITGPGGYEPTGAFEPINGAPEFGSQFNLPLILGVIGSNASLQKNKQDRWEAVGNSSERPLVVAAAKVGLNAGDLRPKYRRIKENVFDSSRKMMSVLLDNSSSSDHMTGSSLIAVTKGAPNVVLQNSTHILNPDGKTFRALTEQDRTQVLEVIDKFSEEAFRVLAVSYKPMDSAENDSPAALESGLYFCGLFASIDPEREEVTPSIAKAAKAGIRTVMITGDYVKTARAIAENIGLIARGAPESKAVDCARIREFGEKIRAIDDILEEMEKDKEEDKHARKEKKKELEKDLEELWKQVDAITATADVYARAKPADKLTIVKSFQRSNNVCSMTGDGVNDAPALKQADIGVAMGITGTDVAKQSALMILTDDNFVNIVEAVEQGRTIYANISKFVFYLLSTNVAEVLSIFISVVAGLKIPLTVLQILWLNLTTDGAPAIALAVEATEPNTMLEGPRLKTEPLLEKVMVTGMVIQGIILTLVVLAVYVIGLYWEFGVVPRSGAPRDITIYLQKFGPACGTALPCNFTLLCNRGYEPGVSDTDTPCFSVYPEYILEDDYNKGCEVASTMVTFTIIFAELARAYSSRSMRESVWKIGFFSNSWMQYGVFSAVIATWLLYVIPGVKDVFAMRELNSRQFGIVFGLCFVPFFVDEFCKLIYRTTGFGKRPIVAYKLGGVSVESPAAPANSNYQQMADKPEEKHE